MKLILSLALLFVGLQAQAQTFGETLLSCRYSIAGNSGNSIQIQYDDSWNCTCDGYVANMGYCSSGVTYGSCGSLGMYYQDTGVATANGKKCCYDYNSACLTQPEIAQASQEEIQTTQQDRLDAVFTNDRSDAYWGVVNSSNRSPSAGRGNSQTARLDACIGHGETDMLGTGSTGWSNCYNKCDSTSNGYCNNTGTNDGSSMSNYVCKDRCDCTMGFGTCAGI